MKKLSISLFFVLFIHFGVFAQSKNDSINEYPLKSISDIIKKKDSLYIFKPLKNNFFLIMPLIGIQPATGFAYGIVGQFTFKGLNENDKFSSMNLGATFTQNKQLLLNFKNSVLFKQNKYFLNGDWRYYVFSQANYGLGTDIIPPSNRDTDFILENLKEPMEYNYFKFHQTLSVRVFKNYYVGGGIYLDWYSNISDKNLDLDRGVFTSHYNYSKKYGYDINEYDINGLSLNFLYDSRNSLVNANKGLYANINYRINISNNKSCDVVLMESRYFIPLSKYNQQHVLSLWAIGKFAVSGNVPYLHLPSIGWDQRSRSGKGYIQGLFRGEKLVYLETEYRFPITKNQLISGTVFTNFTSTSDDDNNIRILQYIQPAAGIGLRILLDKTSRTNLVTNFAWGRHSNGLYLNAGESF